MDITMNETEREELLKALRKRDRFAVDEWFARKTDRQVSRLDSELYDEWAELVEFWSDPDLQSEVKKAASKIR